MAQDTVVQGEQEKEKVGKGEGIVNPIEVKQVEATPRQKTLFAELNKESADTWEADFKAQLHADDWEISGHTLHLLLPNKSNAKILLEIENNPTEEDKDGWDAYTDQLKRKGQALIPELTDELFDELPIYFLENLITAWGLAAKRGFRSSRKQGIQ